MNAPYETGKCDKCNQHWKLIKGKLRAHAVPASTASRVFMRCPGSGMEPARDPQTAW